MEGVEPGVAPAHLLEDELAVGMPAAEALGLDDPVFDIAITPNRPDALGVRGLARAAEARALTIDRVLKTPAPRCNLMEFGDSSINFDLRFWINEIYLRDMV